MRQPNSEDESMATTKGPDQANAKKTTPSAANGRSFEGHPLGGEGACVCVCVFCAHAYFDLHRSMPACTNPIGWRFLRGNLQASTKKVRRRSFASGENTKGSKHSQASVSHQLQGLCLSVAAHVVAVVSSAKSSCIESPVDVGIPL